MKLNSCRVFFRPECRRFRWPILNVKIKIDDGDSIFACANKDIIIYYWFWLLHTHLHTPLLHMIHYIIWLLWSGAKNKIQWKQRHQDAASPSVEAHALFYLINRHCDVGEKWTQPKTAIKYFFVFFRFLLASIFFVSHSILALWDVVMWFSRARKKNEWLMVCDYFAPATAEWSRHSTHSFKCSFKLRFTYFIILCLEHCCNRLHYIGSMDFG